MPNKRVLAGALAAFLVAAPLVSQASQLPDYPFIHANGEAFIHVVPDLGEIDFDISAYDPDSAAAVAVVQARVEEVRALLAEQGGEGGSEAATDSAIRDMRKEMRKSDNPDPKAAPDYDIRCSVHINVRDLSKWRPIMLALLAKPNIDHMSTSFGLRERAQVERDLSAAAVKDAQRHAEALAAGFNKRPGSVMAVSSMPLHNLSSSIGLAPSDTYRSQAGAGVSGERDFLSIEVLKWSQKVDMIFRIK